VLGVMTGKESPTQLCVGVCVCECVRARDNVCDIIANDAYAYKC
jgi:hypothetical protein